MLAAVGTGTTVAIAGCALGDDRPPLDVVVENYRDESLEVTVELFRPDGGNRESALVATEDIAVPGDAVGDDVVRVEDVATARAYRVVATLGVDGQTVHHHYAPDCRGDDAAYDPLVFLRLTDQAGVTWGQTRCGDDVSTRPF